ncbi:hypothetical protein KM043_004501 [Ampulex compressa]|nr:hypothetical protein KM043_004501 [Ampulex compressa]
MADRLERGSNATRSRPRRIIVVSLSSRRGPPGPIGRECAARGSTSVGPDRALGSEVMRCSSCNRREVRRETVEGRSCQVEPALPIACLGSKEVERQDGGRGGVDFE